MPSVACCSTSLESSFGFAARTSFSVAANFAKSDAGLFVNVGFVTVWEGSFIFTSSVCTASSAAFSSWDDWGLSTCFSMRMLNAASAVAKLVVGRAIGTSIVAQDDTRSAATRMRAGRKRTTWFRVYGGRGSADADSYARLNELRGVLAHEL